MQVILMPLAQLQIVFRLFIEIVPADRVIGVDDKARLPDLAGR
jgi:hypothetical protein